MSEKKQDALKRVYTTAELATALRTCWGDKGCKVCPLHGEKGECAQAVDLLAADRLEELDKKVRELQNATENICQRQEAEMVRLAKEMDVSAERGLIGANLGQFDELLACQKVLTELGRESTIRTVPLEPDGWRVLGIRVEDKVIFGEVEPEGCG